MPEIRCRYSELVKLSDLKPHPKNRNTHPQEQIERLAKIIEYQGVRHPIVVSKRSGLITKGHGRLAAAKFLKMESFPVEYQEYESDEQEYADLIADNAISDWSQLNFSGINTDLPDLGPDFDIDVLGIQNFVLDISEKIGTDPDSEWVDMPEFNQDDLLAVRKITINFRSQNDVVQFAEFINQQITDKTRWLWYPELERAVLKDKAYTNNES